MRIKTNVRGGSGRSSSLTLKAALAGGLLLLACSQPAGATVAVTNFDPPTVKQGPSTYVAAGARQTIVTTPATFTGGVVLGFATFFPAISFATAPNVYGTADFGNNLATSLNIGINSGFATSEVSFALFNGETFGQSYTATAFDGTTAVASQTLVNIAANFNAGYGLIDLTSANITSVSITPLGAPSVWDFLIDTVAFNQTVQQGVTNLPPPNSPPPSVFVPPPPVLVTVDDGHHHGHEVELELDYGDSIDGRGTLNSLNNIPPGPTPPILSPVPEPAAWAMMLVGFGGIGALLRRRRGQTAPVAA
jgi:hypothetical protein